MTEMLEKLSAEGRVMGLKINDEKIKVIIKAVSVYDIRF